MPLKEYPANVTLEEISRIRRMVDAVSFKAVEDTALNRLERSFSVTAATATFDPAYTIALVEYTATGAVTLNLLTATLMKKRVIVIKDAAGNAGTHNITIDAAGSEVIDGATTLVINANYGVKTLYCDGTEWHSV